MAVFVCGTNGTYTLYGTSVCKLALFRTPEIQYDISLTFMAFFHIETVFSW